MSTHLTGCISEYNKEDGFLTAVAPLSSEIGSWIFEKQQITECEIVIKDGREISPQQRRKIYATINDIALYTGDDPEFIKYYMKYKYVAKTGEKYFSLSDTDMTTANKFLEFLLFFCIEFDVPCSDPLAKRAPDIGRYVYKCICNKKCCISGQKAELHHVNAVGRRNRDKISHLGMEVLPLSRQYHAEAHSMGNTDFCKKYNIYPVKLDEYLCGLLKLNTDKEGAL